MTLGQKLKKARLDRGLTQAQVVGDRITRNMLSQLENGPGLAVGRDAGISGVGPRRPGRVAARG